MSIYNFPEVKFEVPKITKTIPLLSSTSSFFAPPNYNKNFYKPGTLDWKLKNIEVESNLKNSWNLTKTEVLENTNKLQKTSLKNLLGAAGINAASNYISDKLSNSIFGESELGRGMGNLFSTGLSSISNTAAENLIKGDILTKGMGINAASSLSGAGVGIASNLIGQGITSAMGDSRLGRGIGAGISTGLGTLGGLLASNLVTGNGLKLAFGGSGLFSDMSKMEGAINPYALGATVAGAALGAAAGPSKEYGGKYGGITRTLDTAYDLTTAATNFIPGAGLGISSLLAINKGLSNLFGSTDGMTAQDAFLGSAFMPAPVKWLNMLGSSTTGSFKDLSWQNSEKANAFMGNAFGNLNSKFDLAREEAGKTYGTFSQGAYEDALDNLDFANYAWLKILAMADKNELQNIRSQYMSSINNLRYAQNLAGGFKQTAIGKLGMKIFNNATNHKIGMRLLSGAALIDNKQMILCSAVD